MEVIIFLLVLCVYTSDGNNQEKIVEILDCSRLFWK
jgi:hypothetical protein